jgi:hypothetical protein
MDVPVFQTSFSGFPLEKSRFWIFIMVPQLQDKGYFSALLAGCSAVARA